jgi:MerR family redox-sensitive transcriptional activator SoxR
MPASTIRYYETIGLIDPQRRISGRRVFDDRAVFALEFVQLAQAAGFSIAEMKSVLQSHADDPSPAGVWAVLAEKKRSDIRAQIKELERMDRVLTALLSCRCASLSECVEKARARRCPQHTK